MTDEKLYHVVAIHERGTKVYMTASPCTHKEGCAVMRALTQRPERRLQLEPIEELPELAILPTGSEYTAPDGTTGPCFGIFIGGELYSEHSSKERAERMAEIFKKGITAVNRPKG